MCWKMRLNIIRVKRLLLCNRFSRYLEVSLSCTLRPWLYLISTRFRILSPGLENNHTSRCCFCNFTCVRFVGKKSDEYFNVPLYSNIGDSVQKRWKTKGLICPYFEQESRPCPLDWRTPIHWNVCCVFFQQLLCMLVCWKMAETIFQCIFVL